MYSTNIHCNKISLADSEGGGGDVRPSLKNKKSQINIKKINGEERKERERREVQSLRLKLS